MSWIIAENLCHAYGAQQVLAGVSLRLAENDRVGLIGPNGQGKTTLLRILAGELEPTLGQLHRARGLRVGYLPQDPPALAGQTIRDAMVAVFADLHKLEADLHELADRISAEPAPPPDLLRRYDALQAELETRGAYNYRVRIEQVLTGLGFDGELADRPLAKLSGGQRTRAYLASLLLAEPDILLLDEPTNHLDIESVEWLERHLSTARGALVVVSHDRWFLDRVTQCTWEVAFTAMESYGGPYSTYVTQRAIRHTERQRAWEAQQELIAKTREFVARYGAAERVKQAKGRVTRLERQLRDHGVQRPQEHKTIHLSLSANQRAGDIVLRADDLRVGYAPAAPLVTAEHLEVQRGQRVAIVGANGTGKTALLKTLLGRLAPLAGQVKWGASVNVGYLSQTHDELDPNTTALAAVMDASPGVKPEEARTLLGSLLLSGDDALKTIAQLSGGQRSRVVLARLVMAEANVLLLDEPTNHLDIPSTEILQDVLANFDGTVLFVTHDRMLIQAVATHVWAVPTRAADAAEPPDVHALPGGWEKYVAWREQQRAAGQSSGTAGVSPAAEGDARARAADFRAARKQANLLQRLQRRHAELETLIETAEHELAELNQSISAAGEAGDLESIDRLGRQYQQTSDRLKTLWQEWEEVGVQLE